MSWPRLRRLAMPNLPTVKAMAPKAPSGARRMTMATMRNSDVGDLVDEPQHQRALGLERRERHAEEDGEEQHLEDVAPREGVGHVLGNDVEQEIDGAEGVAGRGVARDGAGVELRRVDVHPRARPHRLPDQQPEGEGEGGQHLEVDEPLETDAPHPLEVAHLGDARHHRREDDGRDQHLDELDEAVAQRLHRRAEGRVEDAEERSESDRHQHLGIEAMGEPSHGTALRGVRPASAARARQVSSGLSP